MNVAMDYRQSRIERVHASEAAMLALYVSTVHIAAV